MSNRPYREEFWNGLEALAKATRSLKERQKGYPVIVGGAAVEFYTTGEFDTGDFDLVTAWQGDLEKALIEIGFEKPRDRTRGLQHYGMNIGVEVVGAAILDGFGNRDKIFVADLDDGLEVAFIGAEDLIADRVAQYDSCPAAMRTRLDQAIVLWRNLLEHIDKQYLDAQIRKQAPGLSVDWLEQQATLLEDRSRDPR